MNKKEQLKLQEDYSELMKSFQEEQAENIRLREEIEKLKNINKVLWDSLK